MEQTSYLKVWLCKAPCHGNHGSSEWTGDTDGGQELRDVWCQAEWNGAISVQVACGVIDVEAEVGDVQLSCVLKSIKVKVKVQVINLTNQCVYVG